MRGHDDRSGKSSTNTGTGTYDVLFNKNISSCAWVGGPGFGSAGGTQPASFVTTAAKTGASNGVTVSTFSLLGLAANEPFLLQVMC
jgi:hypothetical protein